MERGALVGVVVWKSPLGRVEVMFLFGMRSSG